MNSIGYPAGESMGATMAGLATFVPGHFYTVLQILLSSRRKESSRRELRGRLVTLAAPIRFKTLHEPLATVVAGRVGILLHALR